MTKSQERDLYDEIDKLRIERDGYRRGLALLQGDTDPDWDEKFATILIENATLVREVERLRCLSSPEFLEALNLASGLCLSEANRWESAHPPTAAHWRSVAIRLQAGYLATGG